MELLNHLLLSSFEPKFHIFVTYITVYLGCKLLCIWVANYCVFGLQHASKCKHIVPCTMHMVIKFVHIIILLTTVVLSPEPVFLFSKWGKVGEWEGGVVKEHWIELTGKWYRCSSNRRLEGDRVAVDEERGCWELHMPSKITCIWTCTYVYVHAQTLSCRNLYEPMPHKSLIFPNVALLSRLTYLICPLDTFSIGHTCNVNLFCMCISITCTLITYTQSYFVACNITN